MIIIVLFFNVLAMISCGIAAHMNFSSGETVMGVAMIALFMLNLAMFATNLGRI